mmetsp:Transcript_103597/g.182569  ORF Transcript_103597/g.182569 Transcript_103597/m.182569 type:complete len:119 (+) Transcript_103597:1021-1377(+)
MWLLLGSMELPTGERDGLNADAGLNVVRTASILTKFWVLQARACLPETSTPANACATSEPTAKGMPCSCLTLDCARNPQAMQTRQANTEAKARLSLFMVKQTEKNTSNYGNRFEEKKT